VHDTVDLEDRGLPSVFVATVEFVSGADAQARALGAEASAVYVEHPIQDRTNDEMKSLSDDSVEAIVRALVKEG
jgi:hypothetical protein